MALQKKMHDLLGDGFGEAQETEDQVSFFCG